MSATTTDRQTAQWRVPGAKGNWPVAATTKIPAGVMVARDTSGNAVNASDAASRIFAGVSIDLADNTSGAAGDITVDVHEDSIHRFANSGDIAIDDIGKECYVADNQTVVLADPGHALKAGRIYHVETAGVWVNTRGYCMGNGATS